MTDEMLKFRIEQHDKHFEKHDAELEGLGRRMDNVERSDIELKMELKNVCTNLNQLLAWIKWFAAGTCTVVLGCLAFLIQQQLF